MVSNPIPHLTDKMTVPDEVGEAKARQPALLSTEEFTGPSGLKVVIRDHETIQA